MIATDFNSVPRGSLWDKLYKLEIFLELSPAVLLIPSTTSALDGGFGFH